MPGLTRRGVLVALSAPAVAQPRWAPDRPVTFQVGFPAGGTVDYMARLLARELVQKLGQNVVVENRTGASGNLATQALARAPPMATASASRPSTWRPIPR